MSHFIRYFTWVFALLLAVACQNNTSLPIQKVVLTDTADVSITDWQLIGPFLSEVPNWVHCGPFNKDSINGECLFQEDAFTLFGLSESSVRASDLKSLERKDMTSILRIPDSLSIPYHNLHGMIDLEGVVNTNAPGIIYAACILNSKKEQDVVFLSGGDESAVLYVNGEKYASPVQNAYRLVYQNYIFAHLKKGNNFILLKSANTTKCWTTPGKNETWRHILNMCSPQRFNDYYLKLEKMLIKKPVVPFQHPLEINLPPHPVDPVLKVAIVNYHGDTVLTPEYSRRFAIQSLEFGWYKLILTTTRNTYEQEFYYGDIYTGIEPYVKEAKSVLATTHQEALRKNLSPLVDRYDILYDYYKENYFKISQSVDGIHYTPIDTFVTNPTRLIPLQHPNKVMLETIKIFRNPIAGIQFFDQQGAGYQSVPYLQTDRPEDSNTLVPVDSSIRRAASNDAFLDTLYFSFPEGVQPEYMQLLTYDMLENREIDRRYIFLYQSIRDILGRTEAGDTTFKNQAGTHLRSFCSEVEDQDQYYIVQAPERMEKDTTPRPLVVVVPWVFNGNYPFLRSFIVADIHVHEMYQWQANLRDFIVVHTNARTYEKVVTEPISINNILRTIEEVKKDYPIDTTRIHLFAYCGGTEMATILAEKYPGKFASLGMVAGFFLNPGSQWAKNMYGLNFTENLTNLPIRISHGEYDRHTPIASMQHFVEVARSEGNKQLDFIVEKELTFEAYPRLRHHEEMFNFFAQNQVRMPESLRFSTANNVYHQSYWLSLYPAEVGQKATVTAKAGQGRVELSLDGAKKCVLYTRMLPLDTRQGLQVVVNHDTTQYQAPLPEKLVVWSNPDYDALPFQKNEYTEGPLLHAFSERYILVRGTRVQGTEKDAMDKLLSQLVSEWDTKYHVKPMVKRDVDITPDDMQNANLVLLGNQWNNVVFKRMYSQLPLKIFPDRIQLLTKTFTGTALGYYMLYPNPENPKKYVVLWGGNNLQHVIPRKGIPALNGYFDYEIYSYDTTYQYLLDNGYFTTRWLIQE